MYVCVRLHVCLYVRRFFSVSLSIYIRVPLNVYMCPSHVYMCLSLCLSVSLSINVCVPLNVGICSYPVRLCASPYLSCVFLHLCNCPSECRPVSISMSVCILLLVCVCPFPPSPVLLVTESWDAAMECAALRERMTLRTQTFTVL